MGSKKIIKKIIKIMKPFDRIQKMEEITPEILEDTGIFRDPASLSEEDLSKLLDQANFCRQACFAVDKMDPLMLNQIESIASTLQEAVGDDFDSDDMKTDDVSNLLSSLVTSVSSAGANPENIMSTLQQEIDKSNMSEEIKTVVPKIFETFKNATSEKEFDESDFM